MKIDVLQHVPFEGLAAINQWGDERNVDFHIHRIYQNDPLPVADKVDFLLLLGGPMSANDPIAWLKQERQLIQELIEMGKPILGICLGAQQIAKTLGANIYQGQYKEVGWHHIQSTTPIFDFFPKEMVVFHWHGEQFELPKGADRLFESEACRNQGFVYHENVVGLQFHFESTNESVEAILQHDGDYMDNTTYVQQVDFIRHYEIPAENKLVLFQLLDHLYASR
ncbi:type 1 glutamine amidotransferase [Paraliobacillus ryukyuensis]|uniref:type 1 glutamine amidotransferase n=1 Tax=Paraliobacillus ryukyuensis TaxID=200904 RepID=UPI0009A56A72|nr:type 1 glutamine amidotransferase [Paraliobacillus ryukyuensis]